MEGFGATVRDRYVKNVCALLKDNAHFVIATCNWTKDEIVQQMKSGTTFFQYHFRYSLLLIFIFPSFFDVGAPTHTHTAVWGETGKQCYCCSISKAINLSRLSNKF